MICAALQAAHLEFPARPAVLAAGSVTTYGELYAATLALGDVAASYAGRRVGVLVADLARRLALLAALDRAGASAWLLPAAMREQPPPEDWQLAAWVDDMDWTPLAARDAAAPPSFPVGEVVLLTSGTSGPPKPVRHTWATLGSAVRRDGPAAGGRWLLAYDTNRFAGLQVLLQALFTGGSLSVPATREAVDVRRALLEDRVEFASATPTFWRMFIGGTTPAERAALPLRQVTLGGEVVGQGVLDALAQAFPQARIVHIYASTEMGHCFSVADGQAGFPAALLERADGACQLRIADDGELWIRSRRAMRGYVAALGAAAQPDQATAGRSPGLLPSAEKSIDSTGDALAEAGWFPSGDLVERSGDRVFFVGRKSDTISVGGQKVFPPQVEEVVRRVPGVAEVRIAGRASSLVGQLVAAEVVVAPGSDRDVLRAAIMAECRARLAKYQVPAILEFRDRIELTDAGKLARQP